MKHHFKIATIFVLVCFAKFMVVCQVKSVKYQLKYEEDECRYTLYLHSKEGNAVTNNQRIAFNSAISIITAASDTLYIVDQYNPKLVNSGLVSKWVNTHHIKSPKVAVQSNFYRIVNSISSSARYDTLYEGSSIKLFSFIVRDSFGNLAGACDSGIRLYENGKDPGPEADGMAGADYSNGFTMGSVIQLYDGNEAQVPPKDIRINFVQDSIQISPQILNATCRKDNIDYQWALRDSVISSSATLSLPLVDSLHQYNLIIKDGINCVSSISLAKADTMFVEEPDFTFCAGTTQKIMGSSDSTSTWTALPTNPNGAVLTLLHSYTASIAFDYNAYGLYSFVNATMQKRDTFHIKVNPAPKVNITGSMNICEGTTTTITASGDGSWVSNDPIVAEINASGVISGLKSGMVNFTYISSDGCASLPSSNITVNAKPITTFIGSTAICIGDETTVAPSTGGTWTISNSDVATINNIGIVKGIGPGTAMMLFTTNDGCVSNPLLITVNARPAVSIIGNDSICVNATTSLFPNTGGTWSSPNPAVATVTNKGIVTGNSPGATTFIFTETKSGCTSLPTAKITVIKFIEFPNDTLQVNENLELKSNLKGLWFSSDTTLAKIIGNKFVLALKEGNVRIFFEKETEGELLCQELEFDLLIQERKTSILGYAFRDINGNDIFDSSTDTPLPNCQITIPSQNITYFTDKTGYYNILVPPGTYEVNFSLPYGQWNVNEKTRTINASSNINYLFTGFVPVIEPANGIVTINPTELKCNSFGGLDVSIFNNTSQIQSGYLVIDLDPKTYLINATPFPVGANGTKLFWEYTNLLPGHNFTPIINIDIPLPITSADSLSFTAYMITLSQDTLSSFTYKDVISCETFVSNIRSWPDRGSIEKITLRNESLDYLIRFENNGDKIVNKVVVINELDKNIDISKIIIKSSSHPVKSYRKGHLLYFTFDNIKLNHNNKQKSGYVAFQCDFKTGLSDGTVISNNASILMDDRTPLTTNNTINTIVSSIPCQKKNLFVEICKGDKYDYNAIQYSEEGTYGQVISGSNGCDTLVNINITFKSNISNIVNISGNSIVAEGIGELYDWYDCQGNIFLATTTSASYTPLNNGSYYAVITENGCRTKTDCISYVLSSLNEIDPSNISLYPSPTTGLLHIECKDEIMSIEIFDFLGRKIVDINGNQKLLDLSNLENGIYMSEIKTTNGKYRRKFIKI